MWGAFNARGHGAYLPSHAFVVGWLVERVAVDRAPGQLSPPVSAELGTLDTIHSSLLGHYL